MVWHKDYTMMSGLVMDVEADTTVRNIGDEYLLGPSLVVAPVTEFHSRSREVYLPASTHILPPTKTKELTTIIRREPFPIFRSFITKPAPTLQSKSGKADSITFSKKGFSGSCALPGTGRWN
jgi:hypothetical protein